MDALPIKSNNGYLKAIQHDGEVCRYFFLLFIMPDANRQTTLFSW